jgi:hypothetical protein
MHTTDTGNSSPMDTTLSGLTIQRMTQELNDSLATLQEENISIHGMLRESPVHLNPRVLLNLHLKTIHHLRLLAILQLSLLELVSKPLVIADSTKIAPTFHKPTPRKRHLVDWLTRRKASSDESA